MERVQEAIALYLEVEGDSASEKDFVSVQWVVVEAETTARSVRVRFWLFLPRKESGNPLKL